MLNIEAKKKALVRLNKSNEKRKSLVDSTTSLATKLHVLRTDAAGTLIQTAESFVSQLANSPKEFDKAIAEYHIEASRFEEAIRIIQDRGAKVEHLAGGTTAGGIAAGIGVATLAPSAAMAVATTFGTASTGTLISTLSGAAATNASLAWLGGGAIAAGGGGMSSGSAFLALAGPVAWTIGGLAVAGGATYTHVQNGNIASRATKEASRIHANNQSLLAAEREINRLLDVTHKHSAGIRSQLERLKSAPTDYSNYSSWDKSELAALINNVRSLGKLLNKQVK